MIKKKEARSTLSYTPTESDVECFMLEEDIYYFDIKGTVIYDTKTKEMWCEDWEVINEEEYTEAASQLSHYCENFGSKVEEELIGCFKG